MLMMSSSTMSGHIQAAASAHAPSRMADNCCANSMRGSLPQNGMMCGHCVTCACCVSVYVAPSTVRFPSLQIPTRYERVADTAITGKTLMPDTPPPKA